MRKETGILMNADMVRADLEGRKSQTRRWIKPQPFINERGCLAWITSGHRTLEEIAAHCPWGGPGDLVYFRETFVIEDTSEYHEEGLEPTDRPFKLCGDDHYGHYFLIPHYRATEPEPNIVPYNREDTYNDTTAWKPSIHMPKWAARTWKELTRVTVEIINQISPEDAIAEGFNSVEEFVAFWPDPTLWTWAMTYKHHTR